MVQKIEKIIVVMEDGTQQVIEKGVVIHEGRNSRYAIKTCGITDAEYQRLYDPLIFSA